MCNLLRYVHFQINRVMSNGDNPPYPLNCLFPMSFLVKVLHPVQHLATIWGSSDSKSGWGKRTITFVLQLLLARNAFKILSSYVAVKLNGGFTNTDREKIYLPATFKTLGFQAMEVSPFYS